MGDQADAQNPVASVLRSSASKTRHRSASLTRSAPTSPNASPPMRATATPTPGLGGELSTPEPIQDDRFTTPVKKLNLSDVAEAQTPPSAPVAGLSVSDAFAKRTPGHSVKRVMSHSKRRSSSITLGSPLPIPKHSVEVDYNLQQVIGEYANSLLLPIFFHFRRSLRLENFEASVENTFSVSSSCAIFRFYFCLPFLQKISTNSFGTGQKAHFSCFGHEQRTACGHDQFSALCPPHPSCTLARDTLCLGDCGFHFSAKRATLFIN